MAQEDEYAAFGEWYDYIFPDWREWLDVLSNRIDTVFEPYGVRRVLDCACLSALLRRRPHPRGVRAGSLLPGLVEPRHARGVHGRPVLGRLPVPPPLAGEGIVTEQSRPFPPPRVHGGRTGGPAFGPETATCAFRRL